MNLNELMITEENKKLIDNAIKRVFSKDFKGLKVIHDGVGYSIYEYEGKMFSIFKTPAMIDCDDYVLFRSNSDKQFGMSQFDCIKYQNVSLRDILCLGTLYESEGLRIWDYSEVVNHNWTKDFYSKVTEIIKEKFQNYCYYKSEYPYGYHSFMGEDFWLFVNDKGECDLLTPYDEDSAQAYYFFVETYGRDYVDNY